MTAEDAVTLARVLDGSARPRLERLAAVLGLTPDFDVLAVGWATVDRDRTLETVPAEGTDEVRDVVLGAVGVRIDGTDGPIVVLEPVTEGPLAAFLARHGEGVCALYVEAYVGGAPEGTTALGRAGGLRRPASRFGPFVIEVAAAAVATG